MAKQLSNKYEIENQENQKNQILQLLSDAVFSQHRNHLADHTVQIEEPRVTNLLSKFQPDRTVNEGMAADLKTLLRLCAKILFLLFSPTFLFASLAKLDLSLNPS